MDKRIFIEKKPSFDIESQSILKEIQEIVPLTSLKIYTIYDIFNVDENILNSAIIPILVDPITDILHVDLPHVENLQYFAIEYQAGQYDQRADSAQQSIFLVTADHNISVRSGKLFVFEKVKDETLKKIQKYIINPVDTRIKEIDKLAIPQKQVVKAVETITNFNELNKQELIQMHQDWGFSFTYLDLEFIQSYFKSMNRNPTETELKILDTYWSDHCRHHTFFTQIKEISIKGDLSHEVQKTYDKYLALRKELERENRAQTLMDLGTIAAKYLKQKGKLDNWVITDEINASTIEIEADINGKKEPWYVLFKNETHNHPTEIEPFGGASTCIGGAIRDPLSGRAYVYQAMRVTGSANPLEKISETLEGKLPQKTITKKAAKGYSSYGNQIGLATTQVSEIYHEGYKAKRMEVGFVVGATPKSSVVRETPKVGDKILVVGGKTGRDGIGGATGSSKIQTKTAIEELSAEVQKGDAVVERKIQRLFRNPQLTTLIKRSNDFGAGGVSVAIGEIAESLRVYLDRLPTKYHGLNGTELAISESQERMAVVVEDKDVEKFIEMASLENLVAIEVAEVTNSGKLEMFWNEDKIVDIDREFLDSSGVQSSVNVEIESQPIQNQNIIELNKDNFISQLQKLNVSSQKGLIENFDSHVGQTSVLMPLGGKNLLTPALASVHCLPIQNGNTQTVTMSTWGYQVDIAENNTYLMGAYAVIESLAKIVASGGKHKEARLTFQEYFEKLEKDPNKWGKPMGALLGALEAQLQFEVAAIGGKDSMSGSYQDIHVPPTLISFALSVGNKNNVISPEFKKPNHYISIFEHKTKENGIPDYSLLIENYLEIERLIQEKKIISAQIVKDGGVATSIFKMAVGNDIGVQIEYEDFFNPQIGSLILESVEPLKIFKQIGRTIQEPKLILNQQEFSIEELKKSWMQTLEPIFATQTKTKDKNINLAQTQSQYPIQYKEKIDQVNVFLPIFPGTNCEYETEKVFTEAGGNVRTAIFRNEKKEWIEESLHEFEQEIRNAHIIVFSGGFSAGDEPDGSAKYIVSILKNKRIKTAIENHISKGRLILGICNGFQALIKSGLLPYGKIIDLPENAPTLTYNEIGRHINQTATIKVHCNKSPWLKGMKDKEYIIPFSHGEGRFFADDYTVKALNEKHQIATVYIDDNGNNTETMPYNPNGSVYGVEGITDETGLIYGRMGHPERYQKGLMQNIPNMEFMDIFKNGIEYFIQKNDTK